MQLNSLPIYPFKPETTSHLETTSYGLPIALLVMGIWAISLSFWFSVDLAHVTWWLKVPILLWQTFLYTGLFITAHDAMHGVIAPHHPRLNHLIGTIALLLYALLPYQQLRQQHGLHHRYPASEQDPDFHNGKQKNFIAWYLQFMLHYWSWLRLGLLMLIHAVLKSQFHIADASLVWAWVMPSLLSSVQLFYFGTYLPHREPAAGYTNPHRATTTHRSTFWSFLACYHFGYHEEHHEHPHLAWWQLPIAYRQRSQAT